MSIWSDILGGAELAAGFGETSGAVSDAQQAAQPVADVTDSFADIGHALASFYDAVTNYLMWRSIGWIALGVALMFLGGWLLLGHPAPPILPVPV